MEQGRYDAACPKFAESEHQDSSGTGTKIALALCYEKAGKTASAWAQYDELEFIFKKAGDLQSAQMARKKADELAKHLSKVQISAASDTPGLVIRLDDKDVGKAALGSKMPVDPGAHVIEATAPGYNVWQTTVTVGKDGDMQAITIPALLPKPVEEAAGPKPGTGLRTASYIVSGVGVAGLAVGGIFGGLAAGTASSMKKDCPKNTCTSAAGKDERAKAGTQATVATAGLAAGGGVFAAGVVMFFVSRAGAKHDDAAPPPASARLVPAFGPEGGSLTFAGSF